MSEETSKPEETPEVTAPEVETPSVDGAPGDETPEAAEASAAAPETTPDTDAGGEEVEAGKAFSVLSYVLNFLGLPFFLLPLIQRNNAYSLFHAKQCLMVWLSALILSALNVIPCLGQIAFVVGLVALQVFNIIGLINATKGEAKPLPVIGKWGEDWFKGITKV